MLLALIVACEFLFWVFLGAGLVARYLFRLPRVGAGLLIGAPACDLVLLVASVIDLRQGGQATFVHALAAVYLGVSLAYGHSIVRWADVRFAHRFAGGPAPEPKPKRGPQRAAREVAGWLRHVLAYLVGTGLMWAAVLVIGDVERVGALRGFIGGWTTVLLIDAAISFSYGWPGARVLDEFRRARPERPEASTGTPDGSASFVSGART